jgi:two-component system sensor histidine kinase BaeS
VRVRLVYKLLAVNLPLVAAVLVVVWVAIDTLAADYFTTLMHRYQISPVESNRMFLEAVHRYILWASAIGLLAAVVASFLLTRQVLKPLSDMADGARRIAHGDYATRVRATATDEVGELGRAFNAMADDLARIELLRKTMVADVAHELRTPLTNMRGYLEALRDGVVAPEPGTLAMLEAEAVRLVRLVEDLSALTRADAAKGALRFEPVDVGEITREAAALYAPRFAEKGITVEVAAAVAPGPVRGDRAWLLTVLRNLLDNALRYTPTGGTVAVAVGRDGGGGGARVTVTNTGVEIPAADLPFVFERFYRVDKSRSRESGGAGIGLAIVKQLIEAHGGGVGAESGAGATRIWFELPAG